MKKCSANKPSSSHDLPFFMLKIASTVVESVTLYLSQSHWGPWLCLNSANFAANSWLSTFTRASSFGLECFWKWSLKDSAISFFDEVPFTTGCKWLPLPLYSRFHDFPNPCVAETYTKIGLKWSGLIKKVVITTNMIWRRAKKSQRGFKGWFLGDFERQKLIVDNLRMYIDLEIIKNYYFKKGKNTKLKSH